MVAVYDVRTMMSIFFFNVFPTCDILFGPINGKIYAHEKLDDHKKIRAGDANLMR